VKVFLASKQISVGWTVILLKTKLNYIREWKNESMKTMRENEQHSPNEAARKTILGPDILYADS